MSDRIERRNELIDAARDMAKEGFKERKDAIVVAQAFAEATLIHLEKEVASESGIDNALLLRGLDILLARYLTVNQDKFPTETSVLDLFEWAKQSMSGHRV